jgi:hypothetical protein
VSDTKVSETTRANHRRWWQKRWLQWLAGITVICVITLAATFEYIARHAEPIVRKRIIDTVSKRFNSPADLDHVEISALKGLQITGEGLRVQYIAGPTKPGAATDTQPMLSIRKFQFRTDFGAILHASTSIGLVYVEGMELHIPPAGQRGPLLPPPGQDGVPPDAHQQSIQPKLALVVSHVICDGAKVFIETNKPGKEPLEFDIQHVELTDMLWQKAFHYDAILTNPKPTGLIHATGSFGPWQGAEPRDTPIDGNYDFSHADLNSIKGIGGMLSSTGHFSGQLGHVVVDGATDTPNFSIDTSNHPVPLHTQFHAIVDGTNGDTTLDPVHARLLHSEFTARGVVKKIDKVGHDITLDVDMPNARIEDMLQLAVKTQPPLMSGALTMKTKLHIPPGPARVAQKLELAGKFSIRNVSFSNPGVQDKVDSLSMRAQGKPQEAGTAGSDRQAEVNSSMKADFTLGHAMTTIENLDYEIPGAHVLLNGVYSLNGEVFEFKGHVRTDATASQMTTGWKSMLLKPLDPFLKKNGAGLEIPVSISGTKSEPHFGLAFHNANETTEEMKQDLKYKTQAKGNNGAQAQPSKKN